MFQRGDIVWGKIKSYPWWPAMVLNAEDCFQKFDSKNKLWLFWFGDHKFCQVDKDKITGFMEGFSKNTPKTTGKPFKKAIEEALHLLASIHKLELKDSSALLSWASSGFKPSSSKCFKWEESELPDVVRKALLHWLKLDPPDSDDSDMDCDDVIAELHKGLKNLEDICISCCKKNVQIIAPHPLFIGNVCIDCKKHITKACKVPVGKFQDVCIICGQRGNLVFCSNNICFRSFCQMCIECLVSKKAYTKILENDKWLCYLCKGDPNKKCLIKRRTNHLANIAPLPEIPKVKASISVLSFNDIGFKVLEKANIKVEKYKINPVSDVTLPCNLTDYSVDYKDFSPNEMVAIAADFVIGSFFIPSISDDRRKCGTAFFLSFYRFLYRLDIAKVIKANVFFIFLAEAQMLDENILSRVMRFLMKNDPSLLWTSLIYGQNIMSSGCPLMRGFAVVDPVCIMLGGRKMMIWNNLCFSHSSETLKNQFYADNSAVEEKIMQSSMKYLKKYFEKI